MVAITSFVDDERAETLRDLDATRRYHAGLRHRVAALERAGEPADSTFLQKLGWQIDACVTWIARYQTRLKEAA